MLPELRLSILDLTPFLVKLAKSVSAVSFLPEERPLRLASLLGVGGSKLMDMKRCWMTEMLLVLCSDLQLKSEVEFVLRL